MVSRTNYRADTVGSLLRPPAVHAARARFAAGEIDVSALREIEDAAIRDVVRMQERSGLPVVTDGEFRRENWYVDFVGKLAGVVIAAGAGEDLPSRQASPARRSTCRSACRRSARCRRRTDRARRLSVPGVHHRAGCESHDSFADTTAFSWRAESRLRDRVSRHRGILCRRRVGLSQRDRRARTGRLPLYPDRRSAAELLPQPGAAAGDH